MPVVFLHDHTAHACQFALPIVTIETYNLDTTQYTAPVNKHSYYTVIANENYWWRWSTGDILIPGNLAVVGDSDSGLVPREKGMPGLFTGVNEYISFIADGDPGYITFYLNYEGRE